MVTGIRVVAGMFVIGGLIALFAFSNAGRQRRDLRAVLAARRAATPSVESNPFAVLTSDEVAALTFTSSRSFVFATRVLGSGVPDPWRPNLDVEPSLYPILANRLRENSLIASVYVDISLVLSSGFVGVAASQIVAAVSASRSSYGSIVMLVVPLVVASAAVMFRVTAVQEWQAAAAKYRALAHGGEGGLLDTTHTSQALSTRDNTAPATTRPVWIAIAGAVAASVVTFSLRRRERKQ